jgi:hypothetical protein
MKEEWQTRSAAACFQLSAICKQVRLPEVFQRFQRWAVVGGSVRDLLLTRRLSHDGLLSIEFPDIDVAVDRPPKNHHFRTGQCRGYGLKIFQNHFGGLKLDCDATGVLDVWTWGEARTRLDETTLLRWLENVDFGMNAVAFLWPDCKLVVHPRWWEDLESYTVEKLCAKSPKACLQPIRASALAAKLDRLSRKRFRLGPQAILDLHQLLQGPEDQLDVAFDYLFEKIKSKRWSRACADRFLSDVRENSLAAHANAHVKVGLLYAQLFGMGSREHRPTAGALK